MNDMPLGDLAVLSGGSPPEIGGPPANTVFAILHGSSAAAAVEGVRAEATRQQFAPDVLEAAAEAANELTVDLLRRAGGGELIVRAIDRAGTRGIEIEIVDGSRGTEQPSDILASLSTCRSAADELDLDVRIDERTVVRARKFAAPVLYRSELGILGRPCGGERVSGDDALVVRRSASTLLAVADGLGHGPEARRASQEALAIVERARASQSIESIMREVEAGLVDTRGAVMSLSRIDPFAGAIDHAGVGDLRTQIYAPRESRRLPSSPGTLGSHLIARARVRPEVSLFRRGDILVVFSDGLSSRIDISHELELQREHPIVIAESLLSRFGRASDDALVLVLR
jgi:stage II sporulation SpoE-like protein